MKAFKKELQNYATGNTAREITLRMICRFARAMGIDYNTASDCIDKIITKQGKDRAYNYVKELIGDDQ